MTTAKQARNSHFQRGSAVYECRCCTRRTRSTGNGDNEHVQLCAECYDLAGEENHMSDNGGALYDSPARVLELIDYVASKGGNVACWANVKARALELLPAATPAPAIGKPAVASPRLDGANAAGLPCTVEAMRKFAKTIQSQRNRSVFTLILDMAERKEPEVNEVFKADVRAWINGWTGIGQRDRDFIRAYFAKFGI